MSISKRLYIFALLTLLLFSSVALANDEYLLDSGDFIEVTVWGYPELQLKSMAIRPDGRISLPLIGEIGATGMNVTQFTAKLTKEFGAYLVDPKVTVNLVKLRAIRVYVLGEVRNPGMYEIDKEHNLLDAIGVAGGHTKYAAKKAIFIINKKTGAYQRLNYKDLLTKGDVNQNVTLGDGDLIYLASSKFKFATEILPFIDVFN